MHKIREIHRVIGVKQVKINMRHWGMRHPAIAAILILFLLTSGIIAYADIRAFQGDPGLEGAEAQGLVQVINESLTIDDITVTVEKAYADASRVAVWYKVAGIPLPPGNPQGVFIDPIILHPDLTPIATGAEAGGFDEPGDGTFVGQAIFDLLEPIPDNNVYEIVFRVEIGGPDALIFVVPNDGIPQGGDVEDYQYDLPYVGPFDFALTLNTSPPIEVNPDETQISNGVSLTLKKVLITPSQTTLHMCYTLPDQRDWEPDTTLTIDGVEMLFAGGIPIGESKATPDTTPLDRCVGAAFYGAYSIDSDRMVITIDGLRTSVPEFSPDVLANAKALLAEEGILLDFIVEGQGMRWELVDAPLDMTEAEVSLAVFESMREHYNGTWMFEIQLP